MCAVMTACHGLLDISSDPTVIQEKNLSNASAANAQRLNVVSVFSNTLPETALETAVFTDELIYDIGYPATGTGTYGWDLDTRDSAAFTSGNEHSVLVYQFSQLVGISSVAIRAMRAYGLDSLKNEYLAQLFALQATIITQLAENVCSGFPMDDIAADHSSILSGPITYDSALTYALAQVDSALAHGRDSTRFIYLAQVIKGRVLLDLGRYSEAAAAVQGVPTDFAYTTDPLSSGGYWLTPNAPNDALPGAAVGDSEGGNGLPFVSAHDPRVTTTFLSTRQSSDTDSLYDQTKYDGTTPMIVASGTEARLIEAEAAIHAGLPDSATTILNVLRSTVSGLSPLTTPTTTAAQVDTLYKERAFWLFFTGRRLGDLRRLVINYGRAPNTVFPSGEYPLFGATYIDATALPFPLAQVQQTHPQFTTGCIPDHPR